MRYNTIQAYIVSDIYTNGEKGDGRRKEDHEL